MAHVLGKGRAASRILRTRRCAAWRIARLEQTLVGRMWLLALRLAVFVPLAIVNQIDELEMALRDACWLP
eukprot:scaffold284938_cov27-Tisochrysis_lutea.AAC.5